MVAISRSMSQSDENKVVKDLVAGSQDFVSNLSSTITLSQAASDHSSQY